ncbi:hypothetical protein RJD38_07515 [Vibrio scophthalmi]|uniref:hypothetical protein n=1 Tax=Vibrio scophthalmi TaxID=45658 RepID=UPI00349F756F
MTLFTFAKPEHFYQCLNDTRQLAAFALGAQNPRVYQLLKNESAEIPTSLEVQQAIEKVAKGFYESYILDDELRHSLENYANTLIEDASTSLEDIYLHDRFPEMPLIKYYAVKVRLKGSISWIEIWERHIAMCRKICFSLYEYRKYQAVKVSYSNTMIVVYKPALKQCDCYVEANQPRCFHIEKERYFQLPLPWFKQPTKHNAN